MGQSGELPANRAARLALTAAGHEVGDVIRVESAGDAGAVASEVLFTTLDGQGHRAYITWEKSAPTISVVEDWGID